MVWIEEGQPNPFAGMDIPELIGKAKPHMKAIFYRMQWPSGLETDIWQDRDDPTNEAKLVIHITGEMDLPYKAGFREAYALAYDIGEVVGYITTRLDNERFEFQGMFDRHPHIVTYRDGRMVNIEVVK